MKRSEGEAVTDCLLRGVVHDDGGCKRTAAMEHPVADGADFIRALDHTGFRILQNFKHQLSCCFMIRYCHLDFGFYVSGTLFQATSLNADAFDKSLGQFFLTVHVDQLIFQ